MSEVARTLVCHALLAAEAVPLTHAIIDRAPLPYLLAGLSLRAIYGFITIIDEMTDEDPTTGDFRMFFGRLSLTSAFPLFATQLTFNVIRQPWVPIVNLTVPILDTILYYAMEERPISDEAFQLAKLISVGCIVYASVKADEKFGYFTAIAYLLAEVTLQQELSMESWCVTSALGDYLATFLTLGAIFGLNRKDFS